jgi:hypothetical protein
LRPLALAAARGAQVYATEEAELLILRVRAAPVVLH